MKKIVCALLLCSYFGFSQDKILSEPSLFISKSDQIQINMDENEKATFKSGLGETVEFYPSEIIDLKNNTKVNGLAIESTFIVGSQGMATKYSKETGWVGMDELGEMIEWFEKYAVPNINTEMGKNKTTKYVYNSKEVMITLVMNSNSKMFIVSLKNSLYLDKYFWTESKVKDIPTVLKTIKYLQSKN